jgi:hypothetical protein
MCDQSWQYSFKWFENDGLAAGAVWRMDCLQLTTTPSTIAYLFDSSVCKIATTFCKYFNPMLLKVVKRIPRLSDRHPSR